MDKTREIIGTSRIVPILVVDDVDTAAPACEAVMAAGVNFVEIVLRGPNALKAIEKVCRVLPDMAVGAGTTLTTEQAREVMSYGVDFIVSPGFDEKMVEYCIESDIPVLPGCATAGEIQRAMSYGLRTLKFFPAYYQLGGIQSLEMFAGPFPDVKFIPTGGINSENIRDFLQRDNVLAVGGAWMFLSGNALAKKDYKAITTRLKRDMEMIENQFNGHGSIRRS